MSDTTTTSYGTWCNRVNQYSNSPDVDVIDAIGGGDPDWRERMEKSGALKLIETAYRRAIEDALPPGVSLCGNEFIGPAHPDEDAFDGYPTDEDGALDYKAMVGDIDLDSIIERYDVDNEDQAGE